VYSYSIRGDLNLSELRRFERLIGIPISISAYDAKGIRLIQQMPHADNAGLGFFCLVNPKSFIDPKNALTHSSSDEQFDYDLSYALRDLAKCLAVLDRQNWFLDQLSKVRSASDPHITWMSPKRRLQLSMFKNLDLLERMSYEFNRWNSEVCSKTSLGRSLRDLGEFKRLTTRTEELSQLDSDVIWLIRMYAREIRWRLSSLTDAYRTRSNWILQKRLFWLTIAAIVVAFIGLLQVIPDDWRKDLFIGIGDFLTPQNGDASNSQGNGVIGGVARPNKRTLDP